MTFALLDVVVLRRDIPESGLCQGDVGTVVETYPGAVDVEFVEAAGHTQALVTLHEADLRLVRDGDLPSVRSLGDGVRT